MGVESAPLGPTTEWKVGGGGSCEEIRAVGRPFCQYSGVRAAGRVGAEAYVLCTKEHTFTSGFSY